MKAFLSTVPTEHYATRHKLDAANHDSVFFPIEHRAAMAEAEARMILRHSEPIINRDCGHFALSTRSGKVVNRHFTSVLVEALTIFVNS